VKEGTKEEEEGEGKRASRKGPRVADSDVL
jgi:hypothetical protein